MSEPSLSPTELLEAIREGAQLVQAAANITGPALVYVSSVDDDGTPIVTAADGDSASTLAAFCLVSSLAQDARGYAFKRTKVKLFNTGGSAVGAPVYLSATAGALTLTRPAMGVNIQVVGRVTVVDATEGEIQVDLNAGGSGGPVPGGQLNFGFIAGGAAGNLTLTGVSVGDRLVAVIANDDTTGVDINLTAEFTITATNTINNAGGTATTGKHVEVFWQKLT